MNTTKSFAATTDIFTPVKMVNPSNKKEKIASSQEQFDDLLTDGYEAVLPSEGTTSKASTITAPKLKKVDRARMREIIDRNAAESFALPSELIDKIKAGIEAKVPYKFETKVVEFFERLRRNAANNDDTISCSQVEWEGRKFLTLADSSDDIGSIVKMEGEANENTRSKVGAVRV